MNPLVEVEKLGQSIWYDNIRRLLIENGEIAAMIAGDDLRGITSNPTIFEKAIAGNDDYDEALKGYIAACMSVNDMYEALAIDDIQRTADLFRPVYEKTAKLDGYVSLEVSPLLAHNVEETVTEAKRLWDRLDRPNVMIKIPATPAGIPAIRQTIAAGINVNVTMIFALGNYEQVAEAFIGGLEDRVAAGLPVDHIASVASVFVSRIDSIVDKKLDELIKGATDEATKARLSALPGLTAIANAKVQYLRFKEIFDGERFRKLAALGAQVQRPLWASTGTKNPNYSDVLYLDQLIAPRTVNTVPPATYASFRDHGTVRLTIEENLDGARATLAAIAEFGIDLDAVCQQLQDDGVKAFADSFVSLMQSITDKEAALSKSLLQRSEGQIGPFEDAVLATVKRAGTECWIERIWNRDASLWKTEDAHQKIIRNSLGWVGVTETTLAAADELLAFAARIRNEGFRHIVLLGMGGSSLCPEVFRRTFGRQPGFPELHVLDSTDPATVRAIEQSVDLPKTLFIVASKSGSTIEPLMFYRYFYHRMTEVAGERAGEHFIAITDPGTLMEQSAKDDKFRRIFLNPSDIGGRYSALSFFGAVPAALMGLDLRTLLERADQARQNCSPGVRESENPGLQLGAAMGAIGASGCNKLTLTTSPELESLGLWIEQLVAESTGKEDLQIVPVVGEPLGPPSDYGKDRLFVHISIGQIDPETDDKLKALRKDGHPVIRRILGDTLDLGEELYLWEIATAIAGAVLGINPFDQPNVQESKDNTRALLAEFEASGSFSESTVSIASDSDLTVFATPATGEALGASTVKEVVRAHLARIEPVDYVAILGYIQETPEHEELLQQIRQTIGHQFKVATTTGYGPRFLHSTGQMHKGGDDSGLFIQLTANDNPDLPIPGAAYSFGILKQAQAIGDFQSLASRDRRAIRIHLGSDIAGGLRKLLAIVSQ
jgi:transaldolase/glucose-6-phosphate isomerase